MPLKIILKPGEKIVINQAVLSNGGQKAELIVHNNGSILREKDILTEENASTPAKRLYYVIQLLYLFPDTLHENQIRLMQLLKDFVNAVPEAAGLAQKISEQVSLERYYAALRLSRTLIDFEKTILARDAQASGNIGVQSAL